MKKVKKEKKKIRISLNVKRAFLLLFSLGIMGFSVGAFVLYGPRNWVRERLITTAMTTMSHQYLATWFFDSEWISEVLAHNVTIEPDEDTNPDYIKMDQEVTEYKIKFVTTHPYKKMFYIDLLKGKKTQTDSFIYKTNQTLAENIIALIVSIKASSEKSTNSTQQVSAADELLKFKELLDCGAITQEEFDQKKKQLLGV